MKSEGLVKDRLQRRPRGGVEHPYNFPYKEPYKIHTNKCRKKRRPYSFTLKKMGSSWRIFEVSFNSNVFEKNG